MRKHQRLPALDAIDLLVVVGHALVVRIALHAEPHHLVGHGIGDGGGYMAVRVKHEHGIRRGLDGLDDVVARSRPCGIAVDLVAIQVGDHKHLRQGCGKQDLRSAFVALDNGPIALALAGKRAVEAQRRGDALRQVRARRVVGGAPVRVDDGLLHHMSRRGLAVRAGDDDGLMAGGKLVNDVGIHLQREHARQRAGRPAQQAHGFIAGLADGDGSGFLQRHDVHLDGFPVLGVQECIRAM